MLGIRFGVSLAVVVTSMLVGPANVRGGEVSDDDFAKDQIEKLIRQLDDRNVASRIHAIESLHELGAEARAAIPKLMELLADDDWYENLALIRVPVHGAASNALGAMGAECVGPLVDRFPSQSDDVQWRSLNVAHRLRHTARAFLPETQKKFQAASEEDRSRLLGTLAAIDPNGQTVLPILLRTLRESKESSVRGYAATWLTRSKSLEGVYWEEHAPASDWFPKPSPESNAVAEALILALKDPSAEVRGPAAVSLSTYPEAAQRAVPALIQLLPDREPYSVMLSNHLGGYRVVRGDAVQALSRLSEFADQSLPAFIQLLKTDDEFSNERGVSVAIADLMPHSKQTTKYLTELLESKHPELVLIALARAGKDSRPQIPRLRELAENGSEPWIREDARTAIAVIDPEGQPDAVKFIGERLDEDPESGICDFLSSVGRHASFAVPFLKKHLLEKDSKHILNRHVLRALEAIGPDAVSTAPQIIDHLETDYSFYNDENETTLVQFGPGVVPMVVDALKTPDRSPSKRISCLRVLGRLGPAASNAVPIIVLQLKSEYPRVRETAATALGMIASQPDESLPALERSLADPRPLVRVAAAKSCGRFGSDARRLLPSLIRTLSDDYIDVQVAATFALGQLGSVAAAAVPQLTELALNTNVLRRDAATDALQRIQGPH
jgi:HEAT repeat protein